MDPILFARCHREEAFGIAPRAVEDAGASVTVWEAIEGEPRPAAARFAGVVVFGSSFNVEDEGEQPFITETAALMDDAIRSDVPLLGVCFGAQLLARTLGGRVERAPVRELGFTTLHPTAAAGHDPLLGALAEGDTGFQWHMDTFTLPEDVTLLATGDEVTHQAFRAGDRTWGLQFHLEIDRPELLTWLRVARDELEPEWRVTEDEVLAGADRHLAAHEQRGRRIFERFVQAAAPHRAAMMEP